MGPGVLVVVEALPLARLPGGAAVIPLPVPFISQLIGGQGGANCGPACLSMTLAYRGVIAPTQGAMLYVADIVRDGVPDGIGQTGGYTTFQQLVNVAGWFDLECVWLRSWGAVADALTGGEPVTLLVDNRALYPRQYPRGAAFDGNHFVLLTGYDPGPDGVLSADAAGDAFMVNDPLSVYAWGPAPYTARSLAEGANRLGGPLAIALVPVVAPLPAPGEDEMGIIDELNAQVQALREEVARRTGERNDLDGVNRTLAEQLEAVRASLAERDSTVGAYEHDIVPPLHARIAELEAQVQAAVALAGTATARRPERVELHYVDGSLGYVPEEA